MLRSHIDLIFIFDHHNVSLRFTAIFLNFLYKNNLNLLIIFLEIEDIGMLCIPIILEKFMRNQQLRESVTSHCKYHT